MEYSCRFPVGVKKRQDVLFNLNCLEHIQSAFYLDYTGYHYRQSDNSICRRYNRNMLGIILDVYAKTEQFVIEYHKDDEYYERMLGVLAIKLQRDLRSTLFFHASGFMPVKEYRIYMDSYYANPAIKKYLDKPKISDFRNFRDKLLYPLISRRHVYLYYFLCASLKRIKLFIGFIRKNIRAKEVKRS